MDLKSNGYVAAIALAIGIGIGFILFHKPIPPTAPIAPVVAQDQSQKCKARVSRVTSSDGSVAESFDFEADSNQHQEIKPVAQPAIPDSFLAGGGYIDSGISAGVSAELKLKSWSHSVDYNPKGEYRYQLRKILLEW